MSKSPVSVRVDSSIKAWVVPLIVLTVTEIEPAPEMTGLFFGGSSLPAVPPVLWVLVVVVVLVSVVAFELSY